MITIAPHSLTMLKKVIDTEAKTWTDAAKTASKRVGQETAEARGDWIGNKIAGKITSAGKTKSKDIENETNERQEICIPLEKVIKQWMT